MAATDEIGEGPPDGVLEESVELADGTVVFPATWDNLIRLKNLVQEHNPSTTIFPTASAKLGESTLGIGARFTTLHWPAVDWAMSALSLGLTANQNSIPRELVYDVDVMLAGKLDTVPFPFIGTSVPEGHQGQSVEGMSHGCVLAKLKTGFHRRGIAWSFNADHQPIGGKFDAVKMRWSPAACWRATSRSIFRRSSRRRKRPTTQPLGRCERARGTRQAGGALAWAMQAWRLTRRSSCGCWRRSGRRCRR